jgi:hypothetical protein
MINTSEIDVTQDLQRIVKILSELLDAEDYNAQMEYVWKSLEDLAKRMPILAEYLDWLCFQIARHYECPALPVHLGWAEELHDIHYWMEQRCFS